MDMLEDRLAAEPDAAGRELDALLGRGAAAAPAGVLHVCSCFGLADGGLCAIRIGPGAPRSELDGFLLRASRAQSDAIVTSGSILRSEPSLDHALGDDGVGRALGRHRREVLGMSRPPLSVVMSASGDLPAQHPSWRDWTTTVVWTAVERAAAVRARLPSEVEVVGAPEQTPRALLAWLRARGAARISLEVGPRAVRPFYAQGLVDELWCARFVGSHTGYAAQHGDAWPFDEAALDAWRVGGSVGPVQQASGPWRFDRCRP